MKGDAAKIIEYISELRLQEDEITAYFIKEMIALFKQYPTRYESLKHLYLRSKRTL